MGQVIRRAPRYDRAVWALAACFALGRLGMTLAADPVEPHIEPPKPEKDLALSVADFGAKPDGSTCAWKAFREALAACKEQGASKLVIPKGVYVFNDPEIMKTQGHVFLNELHDLTLEGNGASLVFHQIRPGFRFYRCQRILIKDLSVDWDLTVASPGTVEEDEHGAKTIRIPADFPLQPGAPLATAVTEFDLEKRLWKPDGVEVYNPKDVKAAAPQVLASESFKPFPKGAAVCVRHYVYHASAFELSGAGNSNLSFERIVINGGPGMGWCGVGSDAGFRISHCTIQRKPDSNRLISIGSDGIHFNSTKGNILIEDCDFSLMGDDSVNIHAAWLTVKAKVDARTLLLASKKAIYAHYPVAGDVFRFHRAKDLSVLGEAAVVSAERDEKAQTVKVVFDADLPADLSIGDAAANRSRTSGTFVIRNCYFHDHRARGMLLQAPDGLVENNRIARVQAAAIHATVDLNFWHEGYGCENLVLRGNTIESCNTIRWERGANGRHMAALNVVADLGSLGTAPVHRHVVIEGNTIKDTPGLAILVASADDVTVRNNIIVDSNLEPLGKQGSAIGAQAKGSIMITRASKVTVDGNRQSATKKTFDQGVYVDPDTTRDVTVLPADALRAPDK